MTDLKSQDTPSTKDKVAGAAGDAASSAAEQGQAVAQTAVTEARDVAAHAKDQVASLTAETREQAMAALSSATSEVETQLDQRLGDVTTMARTTAEELRALLDGRPEDAGRTADLARQASERLDRFADRTDERGVRGAASEIADFGRRRPVAFLFGATVAGVLVGRMARATQSVQSSSSSSSSSTPSLPSSSSTLGTAPPAPAFDTPAGAPAPATNPLGTPLNPPMPTEAFPPPAVATPSGQPSAPSATNPGAEF
ncbi:MAG: hypothetical protein JWO77_2857 [Ilumatobacteraceae bacterium]|nr:hypothetical protein [Ilumatobacteraceae bacterium]